MFLLRKTGIKKFYEDIKLDYDRKFDKYGMLTYIFTRDYSFWKGSEEVARLASNFNSKSYFIRYNTEEGTGEFYNQTKMPKGSGTVALSKDRADINVYGGYTSEQLSYYLVAQQNNKLQLVGIPIRISALGSIPIKNYLAEKGYTIYSHRKIFKNQEIKYIEKNGRISNYMLVSNSEVINARQLVLDNNALSHLDSFFKENDTEVNLRRHSRLAFEAIIDRLSTYACYDKIYHAFIERKEDFFNSKLKNQKAVLLNLLKAMHANSAIVDNNKWGLKDLESEITDIQGSTRMKDKSIIVEHLFVYDKSPTGLFCKLNPLLKK